MTLAIIRPFPDWGKKCIFYLTKCIFSVSGPGMHVHSAKETREEKEREGERGGEREKDKQTDREKRTHYLVLFCSK